MPPLATVVIPNFNYARFVGAAVESALAQRDAEVQVVVVDDGSTDGSRELLAAYADRVELLLQDNGGHASALNAGWARARGDVVVFLDADDVLAPDCAATLLAAHAEVLFAKAHWRMRVVDAAGRPTGELDPDVELPEGDLAARTLDRGPGAWPSPPNSGNAYGRHALERMMPVPANLRLATDGWLYELAPLFGRVVRVDRPLSDYRRHGAGNFAAKPFGPRYEAGLRLHRHLLGAFAARARELGAVPDEDGWRERSWYLRLERFLAELERAVPPGTPFAFVEPERLGPDPTPTRRQIRVSRPVDPRAARAEGARFLVAGWRSFDALDGLDLGRPVAESELLRVFAL